MSNKETGGPAFPTSDWDENDKAYKMHGMTMRQYAAIKLKVPDSGTDWLDEMILKSLRDENASKAMQAILSDPNYTAEDRKLAEASYAIADAMLKAREQNV